MKILEVDVYKHTKSLHAQSGKLSFSAGWFNDDPFVLLGFKVWETYEESKVIIQIQITYFEIGLYWR